MELDKNYPWLSSLEVSQQVIQDWQDEKTKQSLTFWALSNRKIDQKAYFDWAIDHYQMPFLNCLFFEQNLMTKTQWNEIKDLFDWTEEILPVAFWNNTIFIGIVEPLKKEINISGFKTRCILVNYESLHVMWKFVQSLSHFIEKEITRSRVMDKPVSAEPIVSKLSVSPETPLEKPLDKPVNAEHIVSKLSVSPETPLEKPLDKPVNAEPIVSKLSVSPETPLEKPLDKPVNAEPMMSLEDSSFPEAEEERAVEDNNTFPGRYPSEDNVLFMKNVKKENKHNDSKSLADSKAEENTKFTFVSTVDKNLTHSHISYNFDELWKYTKLFYNACLVLKVSEEKLYPVSWTGRIRHIETEFIPVDLNDYSLFKILKRGHPYNGFVVDHPVNRSFFSQIGWDEYPKHVTAIPIKNNQNILTNVFVGLSITPISRKKVSEVEEKVLQIFQGFFSLSQAA